MRPSNFVIRKAAVLGTGIMGLRIAAHLANADVPVVLFGRPGEGADPNARHRKAIDGLRRTDPSAFVTRNRSSYVDVANYEHDLDQLRSCDLVIEAIAEEWDAKQSLYGKIAPHIGADTIVASNTSGTSINRLAELIPAASRGNFCGMHIFNPPRYMALIELIPGQETDPAMLDDLESWLVTRLGKSIVRAKDTQSFIANRIGLFSILAVMHHTKAFGLGLDVVDTLTGRLIEHPASGTFRTADMIGLDTLSTVMDVQHETLPDDPWREYYKAPDWFAGLIEKGALGLKTKGGIYRKVGKEYHVLDLRVAGISDPRLPKLSDEVTAIFKIANPVERFAKLRASKRQTRPVSCGRPPATSFITARITSPTSPTTRAMSTSRCAGAGVGRLDRSRSGKLPGGRNWPRHSSRTSMPEKPWSNTPLPAWVMARDERLSGQGDAYSPAEDQSQGSFSPPVSTNGNCFQIHIVGRAARPREKRCTQMTTMYAYGACPMIDKPVSRSCLSRAKCTRLARGVVDGIYRGSGARPKRNSTGWCSGTRHRSGSAQISKELSALTNAQDNGTRYRSAQLHTFKARPKHCVMPRYLRLPAVDGMAFGGGAEVAMHCAHRVLALESHAWAGRGRCRFDSRRRRLQGDGTPRFRRSPNPSAPERSLGQISTRHSATSFAASPHAALSTPAR